MGHFTIYLPGDLKGDVRWGTIKKKSLFLDLFKKGKSNWEIKKGYIVKLNAAKDEHQEYHFLKTQEGKWTADNAGGFHVSPDDEITASIKIAIDNYESEHCAGPLHF